MFVLHYVLRIDASLENLSSTNVTTDLLKSTNDFLLSPGRDLLLGAAHSVKRKVNEEINIMPSEPKFRNIQLIAKEVQHIPMM